MKIKNINGTSSNICDCGSWLEHWKKFSGQSSRFCVVSGCNGLAEVGAHVQKDVSFNNNWYIVPLCKEHNKVAGSMEISDYTTLVSANVNETCRKSNRW